MKQELANSPELAGATETRARAEGACTVTCQSFREGCVGCCVNMRWSDQEIRRFLTENTVAAKGVLIGKSRPRFGNLLRLHLRRGGLLDFLWTWVFGVCTCGFGSWLWSRRRGSCPFAGFLDDAQTKAGCLIHPARYGYPDLRRHAFPAVPLVVCNTALECPSWPTADEEALAAGIVRASRRNGRILQRSRTLWNEWCISMCCLLDRFRRSERGDAIIEYVMITAIITVGVAMIMAPRPGTDVANMYDLVRRVYRRALVVVSTPLL